MPATSPARVDWVDTAKGIAIFLVAVHHSVLLLDQAGLLSGLWMTVNKAFQIFRMPLFFATSGLFAASVVARPWKDLWSRRLSLLVWVFGLWSVIRFVYFLCVPMDARPQETNPWLLLLAPLAPSTGLWFLHALFFFFVVAKLMHNRVDYRVQLGLAAALSMVFLANPEGNISWVGMGQYFFFFLAGCYLRNSIIPAVAKSNLAHLAGATVLFGAGLGAIAFLDLQQLAPVAFAIRVIAVAVGCLIAAWLASWSAGRVFTYLGHHTLPIYVAHVLVVAAAASALSLWKAWPAWMMFGLPPLVAVFAVACSLGIHRLALRAGVLKYAYETPKWFSGKPARRAAGV